MAKTTVKIDIYQEVTNQIVALLEAGTKPWEKSWIGGAAALPLRSNGENYQGINVLLLWGAASVQGFSNPHWMTFKQAQELGANVKKGEKGTRIVYANKFTPKGEEGAEVREDSERRQIAFLKFYTVFNVEQIENLPEGKFIAPERPNFIQNADERSPQVEQFFKEYGVPITEREGSGAFYQGAMLDRITMPLFESFTDAPAYYATLAHEAIHSTGHETRLNRDTLHKYGESTATRAKEELVAEIGAAMLSAALGIETSVREDHASYVASWLTALKNDKRFIFQAATAAQSAATYIQDKASIKPSQQTQAA